MTGKFFIMSGPSGVGKNTIADIIIKEMDSLEETVSATTRAKRKKEKDGVHYHFLNKEQFIKCVNNNEMLEWAEFAGNYYGTLKRELYNKLDNGLNVLSVIEVQGANQIMKKFDGVISIFLMPPSKKALYNRLCNRGYDSKEYIEKRITASSKEINLSSNYDYIVINDDLETAVNKVRQIIIKHTVNK
ncbi:MAG: guanylate kinase [Bacilli bacterium]